MPDSNNASASSSEPAGGQTSEFQDFTDALRTIMSVRKDDLDLGPVREAEPQRTSPKERRQG